MFKNFSKTQVASSLTTGLLLVADSASAAIDVTAVVTEVNDTIGPIGLIGSAVLIVIVTIKSYKWVARAM